MFFVLAQWVISSLHHIRHSCSRRGELRTGQCTSHMLDMCARGEGGGDSSSGRYIVALALLQ